MENRLLKSTIVYVVLFIVFLFGSMLFIRHYLDSQIPYSFEEMVELNKDQVIELKMGGIKMQMIGVRFTGDGGVILEQMNHLFFYIMPLLLAAILVVSVLIAVKMTKKILPK